MARVDASFLLSVFVVTARNRDRALMLVRDASIEDERLLFMLCRYVSDLTLLENEIDDLPPNAVGQDGKIEISYMLKNLIDVCTDTEKELSKFSHISLELH